MTTRTFHELSRNIETATSATQRERDVLQRAFTAIARNGKAQYVAAFADICFIINADALACDCGKGLYCPLITQTP